MSITIRRYDLGQTEYNNIALTTVRPLKDAGYRWYEELTFEQLDAAEGFTTEQMLRAASYFVRRCHTKWKLRMDDLVKVGGTNSLSMAILYKAYLLLGGDRENTKLLSFVRFTQFYFSNIDSPVKVARLATTWLTGQYETIHEVFRPLVVQWANGELELPEELC